MSDPRPMDVLPMSIGFAVECMDGAMMHEQPEIRRWWLTVRGHLLNQAADQLAAYIAKLPRGESGQ